MNVNVISTCVKAIKVIHDGAKESKELKQAREALSKAASICCLGFGYHPENVARLHLVKIFSDGMFRKFFLSSYGLTDQETERLMHRLFPAGKPGRFTLFCGKKNQKVLAFLRENAVFD